MPLFRFFFLFFQLSEFYGKMTESRVCNLGLRVFQSSLALSKRHFHSWTFLFYFLRMVPGDKNYLIFLNCDRQTIRPTKRNSRMLQGEKSRSRII